MTHSENTFIFDRDDEILVLTIATDIMLHNEILKDFIYSLNYFNDFLDDDDVNNKEFNDFKELLNNKYDNNIFYDKDYKALLDNLINIADDLRSEDKYFDDYDF